MVYEIAHPPVEDWLSAFMEAEMVITDSFHETVFSIIFNKSFRVIGNEGRGMARFKSFLSMYGLENKLISENSISEINPKSNIDWDNVNEKRKMLQGISLNFLKSYIV